MIIQRICLEDIYKIFDIVNANKSDFLVDDRNFFWSIEQLKDWVETNEDVLLIAKEDDEVIGFALTSYHKATRKAVLENFFILQNWRNKGVGSQLMEEILIQLKNKNVSYICFLVPVEEVEELSYFQRRGFEKGRGFVWFGKHL